MQKFEGIHASDGIAIGSDFVYRPPTVSTERYAVADTHAELARFHHALSHARD
jgi:phosphoenolpyruvate-protein kinase (PTS system EI component)